MIKLSKKQEKEILKIAKKGKSISAKMFNQIISDKQTPTLPTKKKENKKFHFTFDIHKTDCNEYCFVFKGKHYATNRINSFSFKERLAHKKAIKDSVKYYLLTRRKDYQKIRPFKPFRTSILKSIFYNPVSRDDDGNSATLKIVRDILITLNFIEDDKRKNLKQLRPDEVLTKDYKIELFLQNTSDNS